MLTHVFRAMHLPTFCAPAGVRRCSAVAAWAGVIAFASIPAIGEDEPAAAAGTVDFTRDIQPILVENCVKCHGPEKQKGELRLDSAEAIQAGGENGPVLVAGKPAESALCKLVSLPADHPDRMPANGDPLKPEQIALIAKWIEQGASFAVMVDSGATVPVSSSAPEAGPAPAEQGPSLIDKLSEGLSPVPPEALEPLKQLGALALPLDMHTPLLSVNLQYAGDKVTDEALALLTPLANHITWLNLAGTSITDAGLASLANLKKLTRLHLERTPIGDAGLVNLKDLEHLEYLNLYGTKVTDAGLATLSKMKGLRKVYLWNSQVTKDGADKLLAARPELYVNTGIEPSPPASEPAAASSLDLPRFYDEGGCCAKAKVEGKDCEHPCCVEARASGKVCEKCNAAGAKKAQLAALYDKDSCCGKEVAEGKDCEHPCCVEARAKCEVCTKCNPGAVEKLKAASPPQEPSAESSPPASAGNEEAKSEQVAKQISFNRHVRPILAENCLVCHGPDNTARKAGLRLDVRESAVEVKENRAAIVPGDSARSELVRRITTPDPDDVMPPRSTGHALTIDQIALLTQWIDSGAEYEPHWSYIRVARPDVPNASDPTWSRNPIDRFVLAKLDENGLAPSPETDRATLIRRVSFDLIGLPPRPDEVDAFVNDSAPDAYEKLVDRLLSSPHYGERMALDWLDLVRYADTNGYHSDEPRSMWPYRDYIIDAFNANMPFDRFTIEQLAGDLLPNPTRSQLVASGYNRLNQLTAEGGAQPAEYYQKYMADRIRTTTAVWLGSTFGCAECHDHKFDPTSMKDFYSFGAFFADVQEKGVYSSGGPWEPELKLPSPTQEVEQNEITAAIASLQQILDTDTPELAAAQLEWEAVARDEWTRAHNDWTLLVPNSAVSEGGATLAVDTDLVVRASGTNPANDTYTLAFDLNQRNITAIRLETLADADSGKLSRGNGNFVLTGFEVMTGDSTDVVPISAAQADFEQPQYPVAAAIDGDPATGWAVSGHEIRGVNRSAMFTFAQPIAGGPGSKLVVRMKHESRFANHNIAQFRISVTTVDNPRLATSSGLNPALARILLKKEDTRTDEEKTELARHYRSIAPALEATRVALNEKRARLAQLDAEIPRTMITVAVEPREIRILPRGNFLDPTGEIVAAATPHFLPQMQASERRLNRLDLAQWLVSRDNPLTARTVMNRYWKMFFGTGLSKVLDDLGARGEWPTHPELLDWLAAEFMDSGWDLKHMVRLMVTSAAYRQSSDVTPELRSLDPYNRLYARQATYRFPAEFVRDNALVVSGLFSSKIGGPSVFPYQPDGYYVDTNTFAEPARWLTSAGADQYRRGLYTFWKRSFLHPSMLAFDAPTREECTAERVVSNTPLQALALLNDPSYVEAARVFAEKIVREGGATASERISFAYRRALGRAPLPGEIESLAALCEKHMAEYQQDRDAAQTAVAVGQAPTLSDLNPAELAAWTSVARVILNLHETITRT